MTRTININHREIMDAAKASLKGGPWNNAALAMFIYFLVANLL